MYISISSGGSVSCGAPDKGAGGDMNNRIIFKFFCANQLPHTQAGLAAFAASYCISGLNLSCLGAERDFS